MSVNLEHSPSRSSAWKWSVCGVLLLATLLNYMDRQTLAQTSADIKNELGLSNEQYGNLEFGFGIAFAVGGFITGILVDCVPVRWMYPLVVLGWSIAGFSTAYAAGIGAWLGRIAASVTGQPVVFENLSLESSQTYLGLMACRVVLGVFEAGQWPCALVTTQRLLSREERTFGNSLLQSGASIGAILTPIVVQSMVTDARGSWRGPFAAIGAIGLLWLIPWFALIRRQDLEVPAAAPGPGGAAAADAGSLTNNAASLLFVRRFAALACVVIAINITWHYFRAWLPMYLREFHKYSRGEVNFFTSAYYIATDVGCISVGFGTRWLAGRGWSVHSSRMALFFGCSCLTALSIVVAQLPRGPLLLALLLVIGFGSLGLFPNYYSLSQELTTRNQGKVTGTLSATTWIFTAVMHKVVGRAIDETQSYALGITLVGLAPLLACVALALLWGGPRTEPVAQK